MLLFDNTISKATKTGTTIIKTGGRKPTARFIFYRRKSVFLIAVSMTTVLGAFCRNDIFKYTRQSISSYYLHFIREIGSQIFLENNYLPPVIKKNPRGFKSSKTEFQKTPVSDHSIVYLQSQAFALTHDILFLLMI